MTSFHRILMCLTLGLWLAGCTVHTIDIQQGNVIDDDAVAQLKPGMSKRQVSFIMGTPLIRDPFHHDRWDYVYTLRPGNQSKITERDRVTLFFEDGRLSRIERLGQR